MDDIQELFGNKTLGPELTVSANGFLALAKYDANGDGVISQEDPIFEDLQLWQDRNGDAVSQEQEFTWLSQTLKSIQLNYTEAYQRDGYGNELRQRSLAFPLDPISPPLLIYDLWFRSLGP